MAVTAYCTLAQADVSQISPPLFTSTVVYVLHDSVQNALLVTHSGTVTGLTQATLVPPIANQAAVLNALQSAVQAAEPGTPGLSFIWLKL